MGKPTFPKYSRKYPKSFSCPNDSWYCCIDIHFPSSNCIVDCQKIRGILFYFSSTSSTFYKMNKYTSKSAFSRLEFFILLLVLALGVILLLPFYNSYFSDQHTNDSNQALPVVERYPGNLPTDQNQSLNINNSTP